MKVPDEFRTLALQLFCYYEMDSEEKIRKGLMQNFNSEEKWRLASFLAEILDGGYSDADLDRLWNAAGSDLMFARPAATRNFLVKVREWLAHEPT